MPDTLLTGLLVRVPWLGPRVVYRLQRVGAGYAEADWPSTIRSVIRHRPDVVSVDVFDTCIVRSLVGDRPIEHVAGEISGNASCGRSLEQVAADLERELCHPVPGVAESLAELRKAEAQIVFLSDTDRSSELLIEILRSHGLFVEGDRLIASCEAGSTKSDGQLFRQTWPNGGEGRSVWHIGNHIWADVTMSAAAGITPVPVLDADVNRYERAMAGRETGYGPAVAGAARRARLQIEAERWSGRLDPHRAQVQSLGADVAGQSMTAFVLWVAEQCREEGVEHLGFLARDGELPLEVAKAIPADHWQGRTLRYLHCSRFTWSLAAASAVGVERWLREGTSDADAFLHTKRHDIPFNALLARLGLTAQDLSSDPNHQWLAGLEAGEMLPEFAVEDWDGLLADPAIHEIIAVRSDQRLKLIVDSLRADGIPAGKFGLVDVGWRGRLASQVSAVLSQVVGQDPIHFHFGGDKVLPDVDALVPIRRFAFDGVSEPYPIEAPVSCIETLTASGKPRVVDYRRRPDGAVERVFEGRERGPGSDRTELWAGAVRMAGLVPERATLDRWHLQPDSLADEAKALLDHWWNRPTAQEVRALEGLTFEHDEAGTVYRPLVTPYRISDFRVGQGRTARPWPQGSAVASSPVIAAVVGAVWSIRRIRRRLRS